MLHGIWLVISDAHEGIKAAVTKLMNATWQRCRHRNTCMRGSFTRAEAPLAEQGLLGGNHARFVFSNVAMLVRPRMKSAQGLSRCSEVKAVSSHFHLNIRKEPAALHWQSGSSMRSIR